MNHDRDIPAERAALGCALLDRECAQELCGLLVPADYCDPRHGILHAAVATVLATGGLPDTTAVRSVLAGAGNLVQAGGDEYLTELNYVSIPNLINTEHHGKRIRQLASVRAALRVAAELRLEVEQGVEDFGDWLARADGAIGRAIAERAQGAEPIMIGTAIEAMFAKLSDRAGKGIGWPTGFALLDKYLGGMPAGELIVIAGRPGMGKTAFALALATGVETSSQLPVYFQSIEMPTEQIAQRFVVQEARIDGQRLRSGTLNRDEKEQAFVAGLACGNRRILIDDTPGIRLSDFARNLRRAKRKHGGLAMGIVDYLQLMRLGERSESRQVEVSEMSRRLKELAKELSIPIIALAQLNRGPEDRTDHRPKLSDLRESGAIEQDADTVIFLYRDAEYNEKTEEPNVAEVIISKQRSGPTGTVKLAYRGECMRFDNLDTQHNEDSSWHDQRAY